VAISGKLHPAIHCLEIATPPSGVRNDKLKTASLNGDCLQSVPAIQERRPGVAERTCPFPTG